MFPLYSDPNITIIMVPLETFTAPFSLHQVTPDNKKKQKQ